RQHLADLHRIFGLLDAPVAQLRNVAEALDALFDLDKGAEVGKAHDLAGHRVADLVRLEEAIPGVRLQVFDRQRQPATFQVDVGDDRVNRLVLLQDVRRVLDALRPGNVGNVHETVNAIFNLDKGAEVGK